MTPSSCDLPLARQSIMTLTTGPVDAYPEVLRALSRTVLYDYDPAFQHFYENVCLKLQKALETKTVPVILQGEPVLGLQAVAASFFNKADIVLNLVSGAYGDGFGEWVRPHCGELLELRTPFNEVIDVEKVRQMLASRPDISVVSICHHDTPSGTINPVAAIGQAVREHGALFVVDAVSSFAGMDIMPEPCCVDMFVTGPNKCMGCPPGLTILGVSERAWKKMHANPTAPRDSVLSILDWEHAWKAGQPFPYTPSVSEINALDAGLDRYLEEGPQAVWARHDLTARACRAGIKAAGLEIWAAHDSIASPTTTVVRLPQTVTDTDVLEVARRRYGVIFSIGRGETKGRVIRIGHMGPTAQPIYAVAGLAALCGALGELGVDVDAGAACAAALSVIRQ
ncbi:pyridoxamine--pyruvate transaminase [Komagataeibacter rhaeticus]|uniref:pyridoxamine--pyruvate transaminase n=1 Tax=Komagataeibacter rhaeticus TaxID=215221 RepID=UPI0021567D7C|nr:alanine--glyoxylate aminotransferase family protein [Komagataeibacter rhaeticus]GBQ10213.1 serine-pyruvate aminotransferase [Komagataeibacter rhaeticus DSM 16663]